MDLDLRKEGYDLYVTNEQGKKKGPGRPKGSTKKKRVSLQNNNLSNVPTKLNETGAKNSDGNSEKNTTQQVEILNTIQTDDAQINRDDDLDRSNLSDVSSRRRQPRSQ